MTPSGAVPARDPQEDNDIRIISDVVARHCSLEGDGRAAKEAEEALQRLLRRIAASDELYAALTTKYRLVWPIAGVLLTGRRRKALVRDYDKARPDPVAPPSDSSSADAAQPIGEDSAEHAPEQQGPEREPEPAPEQKAERVH